MSRLTIAPSDIARVAELSQVGESTVRRYRAVWDGMPRYQLRRAQEAGHQPPQRLVGVSPTRKRLTILLDGRAMTVDELAQYEEPAGQGPGHVLE